MNEHLLRSCLSGQQLVCFDVEPIKLEMKKLLAAVGLFLVTLCLIPVVTFERYLPQSSDSNKDNVTSILTGYAGTGADAFYKSHFRIYHPPTISESGSGTIVVELLSLDALDPESLPESMTLSLSGSRFDVAPSASQTEYLDLNGKYAGLYEVATWTWNVAPKSDSTGKQELLLQSLEFDFEQFIRPPEEHDGLRRHIDMKLNGVSLAPEDFLGASQIRIVCDVESKFGISFKLLWFIKGFLGLMGFVLMYPTVSSFISKRLKVTADPE